MVDTEIGKKYRLTFYTAHHGGVSDHYHQPTGYIRVPGNHQTFVLPPKPTVKFTKTGTSTETPLPWNSEEWGQHVFYFTDDDTDTVIEIGSEGRRNAIAIDQVSVVEIMDGEREEHPDPSHPMADDTQPIHVHLTTVGEYTTVSASWDMVDPESPVTRNMWAIGSVQGHNFILYIFSLNNRLNWAQVLLYICNKAYFSHNVSKVCHSGPLNSWCHG